MSCSVFSSTSRLPRDEDELDLEQQKAAWTRRDLLLYTPQSSQASLASRVAITIESMNLRPTWIAFRPSMAGWDRTADFALESLCHTTKYYSMPHSLRRPEDLNIATELYSKVIKDLSERLKNPSEQLSDQILLIVSILSVVDYIAAEGTHAGSGDHAAITHYQAIETILLSRPRTVPASDLARAILYLMQVRSFHISLASGEAAKFDDPYYLRMSPSSLLPVREGQLKLRHLGWHAFTALPRLISYARKLRSPSSPGMEDKRWIMAQATALAEELLALEDDQAEDYALHQVRVIPTENDEDRQIVPFSFEFDSLENMLAALSYWTGRLLIIRLCRFIQGLGVASFKSYQFEATEARIIMNTMMTWPLLLSPGGMGSSPLVQSCTIVWGGLEDKKCIKSKSTTMIRAWIRHILQRNSNDFAMDDMRLDEAADVLIGGPLRADALDSAMPIPPTGAPVTTAIKKHLAWCQRGP